MKRLILILSLIQAMHADFAFDLKENRGSSDGNWIYSPLSVSICLSMVEKGANGNTKEELESLLQLPENFTSLLSNWNHASTSSTDFELRLAQGVWVKSGFPILASYQYILQKTYRSSIESVLFVPETAKRINAWIENQTHEKIKNLLSPSSLSEDTRLVLVNALYFKGSWAFPFDVANTQPRSFYPSSSEMVATPFVDQTHSFAYYENDSFQAVALPFASESNSGCKPACLLLLPRQNGDDPFTAESISDALRSLQNRRVHVCVPKFKFEYTLPLKESLMRMGIWTVFSPQADLSGIDGTMNLYLDDVLHKAFVSFDENGIEAAAATAAIINKTSVSKPEAVVSFIADHPFYFLLFDKKTSTILFMGQVQNPCN